MSLSRVLVGVGAFCLSALSAWAAPVDDKTAFKLGLIAPETYSTYFIERGGFIFSVPSVRPVVLLTEMEALRADLEGGRLAWHQEVKRRKFGALDTIITIVLPGGVVYAAGKLSWHRQAATTLAEVSDEHARLTDELLAYQEATGTQVFVLAKGAGNSPP